MSLPLSNRRTELREQSFLLAIIPILINLIFFICSSQHDVNRCSKAIGSHFHVKGSSTTCSSSDMCVSMKPCLPEFFVSPSYNETSSVMFLPALKGVSTPDLQYRPTAFPCHKASRSFFPGGLQRHLDSRYVVVHEFLKKSWHSALGI